MSEATQAPKVRRAEMIKPPNVIKEKVGGGGLDERTLTSAQKNIEKNNVDFVPIAGQFLDILDKAIANTKEKRFADEAAIEAMIYPVMQMKAQGGMFHYPLVTEISDVLVNFLETVPNITPEVMDVILAHRTTLKAVVAHGIKDNRPQIARDLVQALKDACSRYYSLMKKKNGAG